MIRKYWDQLLKDSKHAGEVKCAGVICFGMDAQTCADAIKQILSNRMRCRIYPADGYRKAMSGAARIGEVNMVVDWNGMPCAILETTQVSTIKISDLTDEICAMEIPDGDAITWREKQLPLLQKEVEELGGTFDETTLVTIEEFKKIYPIEEDA